MRVSRRGIETALVGLLVLALVGFAFAHKGVPAAEVDLNDGGVWVTNPTDGLVGHLNYQSRTIDGGLNPGSSSFDVSQEANRVLLHDAAGPAVSTIDTAGVVLSSKISTSGVKAAHGGDTVLVAGEDKIWATTFDAIASFSTSAEPLLAEQKGPRVVVGRDGLGFAVDQDGAVTRFRAKNGSYVTEPAGKISGGITAEAQLTIAGDVLVAVEAGAIRTTSGTVEAPEIKAPFQAQQPSLTGGRVSVATSDALVTVPLGGTPSTRAVAPGTPAAPVDVAGCIYGAWSGSGAYLRDCDGDADDLSAANDTLADAADVIFRVSRDVVAINDAAGNVYLPNEGMRIINDWQRVQSQILERDERSEEESDTEVTNDEVVENADQEPPVAQNDELGARRATSTNLPLLTNDTDVDGDVLTVKLGDSALPDGVKVTLGRNSRSAQIYLPPEQTAPVTFTYQAYDGQDLSNTATVTVTPKPDNVNEKPVKVRSNVVKMSEQASVDYSALPDWVDPDGDPLYLKTAAAAEDGMQVTFRQDGFLQLRDTGTAGAGNREVNVTVSDGRAEETAALKVLVAAGADNIPPIANADHYTVTVGEQVVLRPLSNDSDPNGSALLLSEISTPAADETLETDYEQAAARFASTRAGTHELTYKVSDGPNQSEGKIRIDVVDPASVSKSPSAQNDLALLPANASVTVNVLDNDSDPAGGVIAVQSISMDQGTGLSVEVIDHAKLRISAPANLDEPRRFTYTVSNGQESATAVVLVLPQAPRATNLVPVAVDDHATVRAGDIVSVPVLDNDYSPADLDLSIDEKLDPREGADLGEAFVSGNFLRFKAGSTAGVATIVYTVVDTAGNRTSAKLSVTIRGADGRNSKPTPGPVTARVFAGGRVDVAIPLDGIDPDGDSVELIEGASAGPRLGSVEVKGAYLSYTAPRQGTGTDTFKYRVRDRLGQVGEAAIRVGVVPPPEANQLPVAVPDQIPVRPEQRVDVPVTRNDVDPDGDDISIISDSAEALKPWEAELEVVGQDVRLVAPKEEGSYQFTYRITDGGGSPVTGYGTVVVDPNTPLRPPVATDDRVPVADAFDKDEVKVKVLANDEDPDGASDDLKVTVEEPARVEEGNVVVPLAEDPQVVLYTITDADGLTAQAAIFVPGTSQLPPTINPDKVPAKVKAGEMLRIDLAEYVRTRPNHTAKVTSADKVVAASGGSAEGLKVTSDTVIEFTPDPAFVGPTSVSFEVHDGASLDDESRLTANLTLPIEVESSGATPPTLRPAPVEVAPGEPAITVSLAAMVDDPDEGDKERMAYQLVSGVEGIDLEVSGQEMKASAPAAAAVGTSGTAVVQVHDGKTEPQQMSIPVSVVQSTRPLMTTTEITEPDGRVGQAATFDLTSAVTNPFADAGGAITVVGTKVTQGSAQATVDGMKLTVTPREIGEVVVTYTVQDATGDAARWVTGQVKITVKDQPQAPGNLTAKSDASHTVELAWTQGDLKGGALKNFVVSWNGGQQDCGTVTNCRITGLTNNVEYSFTVAQVTEVGTSEGSAPATARPDVKPNQPSTPTTKFGDRAIDVTWPATEVPDGGSPVTQYKIQISPAVNGQSEFETSSTSWRAEGLTNGTAYRFRIKALNRYAENNVARESEYLWSEYSAPEIPAGAPANLAAPTVNKNKASGAQPSATVSWGAPSDANGDSSFVYELRETGSSQVSYRGSDASATVTMNVSSEDKTFEVRATNKSQLWSEWSPVSNAIRAFQPPGPPKNLKITPTGVSNQIKVTFDPADGKGARPEEIRYRWSAGGASGPITSGDTRVDGVFVNGRDVGVTITPIATVNGETTEGEGASATVNAYAPPAAPVVSASGTYRRVNFSWNADTNSGGRSSTVKLYVANEAPKPVGANGNSGRDVDWNWQVCVRAVATNTEGQETRGDQVCASSWAAPYAELQAGAYTPCASYMNPGQKCVKLWIELQRYRPNSTVACTEYNYQKNQNQTMNVQVNNDGYFSGQFDTGDNLGKWIIATGFSKLPENVTRKCVQK